MTKKYTFDFMNKFIRYEEIRQSGLTNMFDIQRVIELSDDYLTKEDCLDFMKNYTKYYKKVYKK